MAQYNSTHTGQEIDNGVSKALNPDATPTSGSDNLVKSGGVYNALEATQEYVDEKVELMSILLPTAESGQYLIDESQFSSIIRLSSDTTPTTVTIQNEFGDVFDGESVIIENLTGGALTVQVDNNGYINGVAGGTITLSNDYDIVTLTNVQGSWNVRAIYNPYASNPAMNGSASPGTSAQFARGDHVHPSDTSKADAEDVADIAEDVDDLKSALEPVGNPFSVTEYAFSLPTGLGEYWSNDIVKDIKAGDTFNVALLEYSGQYFSKFRFFLMNGSTATEIASTSIIGQQLTVVADNNYTGARFMLVRSTGEAPVTAKYSWSVNSTGLFKDIENINQELQEEKSEQYYINTNQPYNLISSDLNWTEHAHVHTGNGSTVIVTDSSSSEYPYCASDYIPIDSNKEYICNYIYMMDEHYDEATGQQVSQVINVFDRFYFAFYREDKTFVASSSPNAAISKAIPQTAKYIRVTITSKEMIPFARLIYGNYETRPYLRIVEYKKIPYKQFLMPNTGYEDFHMVLFGDSITQGSGDNFSIADYAGDYLNANIESVGFGGTRMTYSLSDAGLFCFYHLCECVVSDDPTIWNPLVNYATNTQTLYKKNLERLMSVDWSTVNAVGILYGANDYSSSTPVGTEYNLLTTNYDGACAYGIKLLLEKYPHLQILVFTPFFGLNITGDYESGMDAVANQAGLYIQDYAESLKNVQDGLHIPIADTCRELGINKYNIDFYSYDGLHPRTQQALFRLGHRWAEMIKRYISPF